MSPFTCDPQEIQAVKTGLRQNPRNYGIGLLHEPTQRIYLSPIDNLPNQAGHNDLVNLHGLSARECKGFGIDEQNGQFVPINNSHLNGPQGQPGSLTMPQDTFDAIVEALRDAGL